MSFCDGVRSEGREYELYAELLRHPEDERVIGIKVTSGPQTEAERFCSTFRKGLTLKKVDVEVTDDGVIVTNPEAPLGSGLAIFHFADRTGLPELKEIIEDRTKYPDVAFRDVFVTLTPGFKIVLSEFAELKESFPAPQPAL